MLRFYMKIQQAQAIHGFSLVKRGIVRERILIGRKAVGPLRRHPIKWRLKIIYAKNDPPSSIKAAINN